MHVPILKVRTLFIVLPSGDITAPYPTYHARTLLYPARLLRRPPPVGCRQWPPYPRRPSKAPSKCHRHPRPHVPQAARERARNSTSSMPGPSHTQLESPLHPHLSGGADEHRRKVRRTHLFCRICANSHYTPFARCWPANCLSHDPRPRRVPDAGIDPNSRVHGHIPSHPCLHPGPLSDSNPSLPLPRSNPLRPVHIDPACSSAHPACPLVRHRSQPYSSTPLLPRRLAPPSIRA
jgi:hypothetical protein